MFQLGKVTQEGTWAPPMPTQPVPFLLRQFSSQNVISVTKAQCFSSLLLLAHHWSVDACGRPPHTPRAGDDDKNGTEKGGATAAHGQGRQVGQEEEAEVQREAGRRNRSSNGW